MSEQIKDFKFRDNTRAPFETEVRLRFDRFGGTVSAFSADISMEGMFVRTDDPKPVGTLVQFEFNLGESDDLIQGLGDVVWVRDEETVAGKPEGMGIQFRYIDPHSRDLIYRIVSSYLEEKKAQAEAEAEVDEGTESAAPYAPPAVSARAQRAEEKATGAAPRRQREDSGPMILRAPSSEVAPPADFVPTFERSPRVSPPAASGSPAAPPKSPAAKSDPEAPSSAATRDGKARPSAEVSGDVFGEPSRDLDLADVESVVYDAAFERIDRLDQIEPPARMAAPAPDEKPESEQALGPIDLDASLETDTSLKTGAADDRGAIETPAPTMSAAEPPPLVLDTPPSLTAPPETAPPETVPPEAVSEGVPLSARQAGARVETSSAQLPGIDHELGLEDPSKTRAVETLPAEPSAPTPSASTPTPEASAALEGDPASGKPDLVLDTPPPRDTTTVTDLPKLSDSDLAAALGSPLPPPAVDPAPARNPFKPPPVVDPELPEYMRPEARGSARRWLLPAGLALVALAAGGYFFRGPIVGWLEDLRAGGSETLTLETRALETRPAGSSTEVSGDATSPATAGELGAMTEDGSASDSEPPRAVGAGELAAATPDQTRPDQSGGDQGLPDTEVDGAAPVLPSGAGPKDTPSDRQASVASPDAVAPSAATPGGVANVGSGSAALPSAISSLIAEDGSSASTITIRADRPIRTGGFSYLQLSDPPRFVVKIAGVSRAYRGALTSSRVQGVRSAVHTEAGSPEIHLVLDLARDSLRGSLELLADGALAVRVQDR